jgi:hypothetical protein
LVLVTEKLDGITGRGTFEPEAALVRVVAGAARGVRNVALLSAGSALVVLAFAFHEGLHGGWLGALLLVALVSWPAVVLFMLAAALRALAELPGRVRTTPAEARERAVELRALAERVQAVRGARLRALPFLLYRFGRVAAASRELLGPHAGALPLVSVPFLGFSAAAILATFVLAAIAILLVLLALS